MTTTSWTGIDGDGDKITFAAEQPNPGGPLTPHFVLEIAGSAVAGPVPVQDAAAEAALVTIATAQGAGGAGITEPTGGTGLLGWLSGIYAALKATLTVTLAAGTSAIGSVSVTALPALPDGTAAIGSVNQTPTALTNSTSGNVTASATIVVPFSSTRKWVMFSNRTTGTETHDLGSSNVAVGGGIPIAAGGGFLFNGPGAAGPIYGITTVASSPFSYVEG